MFAINIKRMMYNGLNGFVKWKGKNPIFSNAHVHIFVYTVTGYWLYKSMAYTELVLEKLR